MDTLAINTLDGEGGAITINADVVLTSLTST